MSNSTRNKIACVVLLLSAVTTISSHAQTFKTLASFDGSNGLFPASSMQLTQGLDGNLYGTTGLGGSNCSTDGCGTVFKITPDGSVTVIYNFCARQFCSDGFSPSAGLALGFDGNFYGVTVDGGRFGDGTVFKITPSGKVTTLFNFGRNHSGFIPVAALLAARDGSFYGTTTKGGQFCIHFCGTVFKITPKGKYSVLHSFCAQSNCPDGAIPEAPLIQGADGNLYGTTGGGGANNQGTVFKISTTGKFATLYSFCAKANCADGSIPAGGLIQLSKNSFYGTTSETAPDHFDGTVFKINGQGRLTTEYTFCALANCADGNDPSSGMILAMDGNFYGTTSSGGADHDGTIFKTTPQGNLTSLYSFCSRNSCVDGSSPDGLLQATNGSFYGVTTYGGTTDEGTIFSLSMGLAPFVEAVPYAAKVGRTIKVLGQGLTGTTAVAFNGVTANFTVQSDTYLTATVPMGATTGSIIVNTPSGNLTSNKQFQVLP